MDGENDALNCGECGEVCKGDEMRPACRHSQCVKVAAISSGESYPVGITHDAHSLYWANTASDGGGIVKAPKEGGAITTLAFDHGDAQLVAVTNTHVYWTNARGWIFRVPVDGGARQTVANDTLNPSGLSVDAEHVYWVEVADQRGGAVVRSPLQGGGSTTLAAGLSYPFHVIVDGDDLFWTTAGDTPYSGTLETMKKQGSAIVTLAHDIYGGCSPVVDHEFVYWGANHGDNDNYSGEILKVPRTGGDVVTLATRQRDVKTIVVDDAFVYWTCEAAQLVAKVPLTGGQVITLATDQNRVYGLTVDDTSVYWTRATPMGSVLKMTPK